MLVIVTAGVDESNDDNNPSIKSIKNCVVYRMFEEYNVYSVLNQSLITNMKNINIFLSKSNASDSSTTSITPYVISYDGKIYINNLKIFYI